VPDIPAALLAQGGPYGVIVVVVLLILAGRLMTRTAHEDRVSDLKDRISSLEGTLAVRDEQVRVRDEQTTKLLAQSDLTVQLLQSLAREAGRHDLET
jgi:hypothetical protein